MHPVPSPILGSKRMRFTLEQVPEGSFSPQRAQGTAPHPSSKLCALLAPCLLVPVEGHWAACRLSRERTPACWEAERGSFPEQGPAQRTLTPKPWATLTRDRLLHGQPPRAALTLPPPCWSHQSPRSPFPHTEGSAPGTEHSVTPCDALECPAARLRILTLKPTRPTPCTYRRAETRANLIFVSEESSVCVSIGVHVCGGYM